MDYQLWKEWEREQGKCNTYESFTCTSVWDFFFYFEPPQNLSGFYLNITHFCMFCGYWNVTY